MQTCPTAAMETLLDLIYLHLQLKRKAMRDHQTEMKYNLQMGDLVRHLQILQKLEELAKLTNHMTPRFDSIRSLKC